MNCEDEETDTLRLHDVAKEHGLTFTQHGATFQFESFTAHGLKQALGFVEGFDRARKS
jgi:hypothetical protein